MIIKVIHYVYNTSYNNSDWSIIVISHKTTSRDTVIYDLKRTEIFLRKSGHSADLIQDHGFVAQID
jgi:hypothetical protein